jgi:glycine/D-amino acid oxidase-like deaminating enzyme
MEGRCVNSSNHVPVAVLGAGLTGAAVALELANQGVDVALIDQDEIPLNRAALRNEGKIHLGLIYANDRTLATARLQLDGALRFRFLLSRWIGVNAQRLRVSTPFVYLVAKDSVLSIDELARHYAAIEDLYRECIAGSPELDYLGRRPERLHEQCSLAELEPLVNSQSFAAAFRTCELAICTEDVATFFRQALSASESVMFLPRLKVASVARINGRYRVECMGPRGPWRLDADQVVNALWENRRAIDHTVGLEGERGWVHRLKYRVIARVPERLRHAPSATIVLGRYGDVVVRPDGTAYLSWYPIGLKGWTHDLAPPESWNAPCRGEVPEDDAGSIAASFLTAIDAWFRGIAESVPVLVDAGAIVAYGQTDVNDASSALHDRSRIGVTSMDGYHSVEPGKLTTAPLFAKLAADRVLEARR